MSLELGRALADAPGTRTMSVDSRGVTAQVTGGAARLERKLGRVSIGVYSGAARIDLLGRGVDVPRLRQLDAAGTIATQREPAPLQLSPRDAWDREFLGDVIDFDTNLDQYANGFNAEFRTKATSPDFYFSFVSYRNTAYYEALQSELEPADILIGTIFGQQVAARRGGDLRRHVRDMLILRKQNATWGLIAKERGLDLRGLLRAVLDAISRGTAPPQTNNNASGGGGPGGTPTPTPSKKPRPGGPKPSPTPTPTPTPTSPECSVLDRLLGTCDENPVPPAGSSSGSSSGSCGVLGILLDPDC